MAEARMYENMRQKLIQLEFVGGKAEKPKHASQL
jgi:hypothetical protein